MPIGIPFGAGGGGGGGGGPSERGFRPLQLWAEINLPRLGSGVSLAQQSGAIIGPQNGEFNHVVLQGGNGANTILTWLDLETGQETGVSGAVYARPFATSQYGTMSGTTGTVILPLANRVPSPCGVIRVTANGVFSVVDFPGGQINGVVVWVEYNSQTNTFVARANNTDAFARTWTSFDDGVTWLQSANGLNMAVAVNQWACATDGTIYAVSNGNGIYASFDGGVNWPEQFVGGNYTTISALPSGRIIVSGPILGAPLAYSDDGAITLIPANVPFPSRYYAAPFNLIMQRVGQHPTLPVLCSMFGSSLPVVSYDNGANWQQAQNITPNLSIGTTADAGRDFPRPIFLANGMVLQWRSASYMVLAAIS